MRYKSYLAPTFASLLLLVGCDQAPTEEKIQTEQKPAEVEVTQEDSMLTALAANELPLGHPQIANVTSAQAPSQGALLGGFIEEVLHGGGYTYVKVTTNGKEHWAAAPSVNVKVGEKVAWATNAPMTNFTSSTLNRTFETVYFVSQFNRPGMMGQNGQGTAAQTGNLGTVEEYFASGGYTYLKINNNGNEVWLAVPEFAINQGATVSWPEGAVMRNFTSRSLNRTFDSIVFVDSVTVK